MANERKSNQHVTTLAELDEWIEHHKSIGFDFILLYNDKSADDTQCVLDAYALQGDVTRVPEDIGNGYMENLP